MLSLVAAAAFATEGISCNEKTCHLINADWRSWNVSICADPQYELAEVDSELVSALMAIDDGEAAPIWVKNYTLVLVYLPTCPFSAKMGATLAAVAVRVLLFRLQAEQVLVCYRALSRKWSLSKSTLAKTYTCPRITLFAGSLP